MNDTVTQLRSIVERVERLEEDKKGISEDIAQVFSEAKGNGFDVKAMKKVIAIRKMDPDERTEQEHLIDTYFRALGEAPNTGDEE